ncbi:hypothetical protein [Marinomonas balearica]|uniref:Zn-dependent peptidase n=1 Tax=Marinomonas balearica TaxID=491947 RepID=A0A4R6M8A9_9GAMM|nr:hypothetical protein [Marinomonas balearica]TDO97584.1 hypothetical protein DFP79_2406 [Marinomonas balearica]
MRTMFDRNKPLFSRPVLAAIMVFATLGIWLLNLISSDVKLPSPDVTSWETESGIPVNWINMDPWGNGNKIIVKFVFEAEQTENRLTEATFDLLMGNSLPISQSTINQRLSPLSAKASSYVTPLQQTLQLTLNSEGNYLTPSLSVIENWLQHATFKPRSLVSWQKRHSDIKSDEQKLLDMLLISNGTPTDEISLDAINAYYTVIQQSTSHISIVGHLDKTSQTTLKRFLNTLSGHFKPRATSSIIPHIQPSSQLQFGEGHLHDSHSMLAVLQPASVQDWATYLIWARDAVARANNHAEINFMQWHLSLTTMPSYVWWSQQYASTQKESAPTPDHWMDYQDLQSYSDGQHFKLLKEQLLTQLKSRTLTPDWWAYISTQITHPNSSLALETFIENYSDALNSFTIEDYRNRLETLIDLNSYQEIQVNR